MPGYHPPVSSSQNNAPFAVLLAVSTVGFLAVPYLIVSAPIEPTMGIIQKIFYFHVPIAWLLLLSTIVCAAVARPMRLRYPSPYQRLALQQLSWRRC